MVAHKFYLLTLKSRKKSLYFIKGVPGNGNLRRTDELVLVLTSVIFTCSVQHAAVNFPQYHEYGYPLNYPAYLHGMPPADKVW